jgi:hypothetical protein
MVLEPMPTPSARPAASMVATLVVEELHDAVAVRSTMLPSELVPVAFICCVIPSGSKEFAGVTAMEVSAGVPPAVLSPPPWQPLKMTRRPPTARDSESRNRLGAIRLGIGAVPVVLRHSLTNLGELFSRTYRSQFNITATIRRLSS